MTGELDAWDYAVARANHRLVEVIVEGDSTMAGQVFVGDEHYSPITRVRELLAAAGIPDGGHGVMNGYMDIASVSGEPPDAGAEQEIGWNINNAQNLAGNYTGSTTVPGTYYEARVYGTRVVVRWALYDAPSVFDIEVDGQTTRVTTGVSNTNGSGADYNWQAGGHRLYSGLTYGLHEVRVTLVSGRLSALVEGTRNTGVVLHNFAARGATAVSVPWHQMQDWAGLNRTSTPPVTPSTKDNSPGAHNVALGIYAKGGNDQQSYGGTDTSALYKAKAIDFARAIIAGGGSAIICSPWWESFNQPQLAPAFREASQEAAAETGALWLDLGPDGALAGGAESGSNNNPHLSENDYRAQGEYIVTALLANYTGQIGPGPGGPGEVPGRVIQGWRLGGVERSLIEFRRPA